MKTQVLLFMLLVSYFTYGQLGTLPMGKVTMADLRMQEYAKDTSASAVVLNEVGLALISDQENKGLMFEKYVKIKILGRGGLNAANFAISLHKEKDHADIMETVEGITYNLENGTIKETKLQKKDVFKTDMSKLTEVVKFAMPNVREGSVIEVRYLINSPFFYHEFRPWYFQSSIPKVHSEYTTLIPGNYVYNASLKGSRSLSKNETTIVKGCFATREGECLKSTFAMDDIEPFIEEDFMTARENFESSIVFELAKVIHFTGRTEKVSAEWKDVDLNLQQSNGFGVQIKKAKNIYEDIVSAISRSTDTLTRARAIYDFVRKGYSFNNIWGIYTGDGVKVAYDKKSGGVADINLSLVGALQAGGVEAWPVILSTRSNGVPIPLHPVISGFNYVVVAAIIGGKTYLLDASTSDYPFGLIPIYCMNGQGRMMAKVSSWIDLKPGEKQKSNVSLNASLTSRGLEGTLSTSYQGYDAVAVREKIKEAGQRTDYVEEVEKEWHHVELDNYEVKNLDSLDQPLKEKMNVVKELDMESTMIYLNPFLIPGWEKNPFKSTKRSYPVDFGTTFEEVYIMNITYPGEYVVEETPVPTAINLAKGGGKLFFNVAHLGNKIMLTYILSINRPVFDSPEYSALKEFFARLAQIKQSQIVFKKRG